MEKDKQNSNSSERLAKENKILKDKNNKKDKKNSQKKIEKLEKENEELKNELLRSKADFENYRKRMQKELEETREKAITSFVIEILPAIDNFEMSLKMTDNKEMFIKGVEMIHSNLLNTLKENHYEQFSPKIGEDFNPYMHEPILIEDEKNEPGKILNVMQTGYKKQDKIVRPARVQIAKNKKEEINKENNNNNNNNN